MCLSCLKTFHFGKFWVGGLICAQWQVNDYPTVSVIFHSFYFGSSYLCGRHLDTRHHKKINPLSSTQLSAREAILGGSALSLEIGFLLLLFVCFFYFFICELFYLFSTFQKQSWKVLHSQEKLILSNWHRSIKHFEWLASGNKNCLSHRVETNGD